MQDKGPLNLNSTEQHGIFFKSTGGMKAIDMRENITDMTLGIS